MERSYLQMFMKIKIKLAAPEALHLHTVVHGTEDHLPYILGFLVLIEPYRNFCIKSFPATSTSRYDQRNCDFIPIPCCWPKAVLIVWKCLSKPPKATVFLFHPSEPFAYGKICCVRLTALLAIV